MAPCDPRPGRIPGARNVDVTTLLEPADAESRPPARRARPPGAEVIAYCHSGSRSALAVQVLAAAGYAARNYVGSWHEWSRDPALPAATAEGGTPRSPLRHACVEEARRRAHGPCAVPGREVRVGLRLSSARGFGSSSAPSSNQRSSMWRSTSAWNWIAQVAVAEPVGLPRVLVRGERHGTGRQLEGVVVPLERAHASRQRSQHGIGSPVLVQLDGEPADLRPAFAGPTPAPAARATSWAPRQTPISGTASARARRDERRPRRRATDAPRPGRGASRRRRPSPRPRRSARPARDPRRRRSSGRARRLARPPPSRRVRLRRSRAGSWTIERTRIGRL